MSRPLTFAEFSFDFVRHYAGVQFKPTTVSQMKSMLKRHVLPALGERAIGQITPFELQRYVSEEILSGLSPRTVRNHVVMLRRMFAVALTWGLIAADPAVGLDSPRQPRAELPFLTPRQLQMLVEATPEDLRLVTALPAYVGLRRGEVLSLRADRVSLSRHTILVDSSKRGAAVHEPKSRASLATVELPSVLVPMFEHRMRVNHDKSGLLLRRRDGSAYADSFANRTLKAALVRAGLPAVTYHQLRGSWVYAHVQAGTPLSVIQRLGRWENVETLIRSYGRWLPSEAGDAADAVGSLIGAAVEETPTPFTGKEE